MPPKMESSGSTNKERSDDPKKPRKKHKTRKKRDDCPSRVRKTGRVVLNRQARDIIAKVYDFMKKEAKTAYAQKLTNARWRTATAVGVSEKTVTRILKENQKKASQSYRVAPDALNCALNQSMEQACTGEAKLENTSQAVSLLASGDPCGALNQGSQVILTSTCQYSTCEMTSLNPEPLSHCQF